MSVSSMKYGAVVGSGIGIIERVPIPDVLIPPDAAVEMEANVAACYCTYCRVPSADDLAGVQGRSLE